jgi:hypothetical protein
MCRNLLFIFIQYVLVMMLSAVRLTPEFYSLKFIYLVAARCVIDQQQSMSQSENFAFIP